MRVWPTRRPIRHDCPVYLTMRRGGDTDGHPLLLLHGLGGTGRVWDGVIARIEPHWHWLAPDLPGHGESPPLPRGYSFGELAAEVARDVARGLDHRRPVTVLGHSLGGVVGLTLASGWFGVDVTAVCGLGMKVRWTDEELGKARAVAAKPARVFATHAEAVERALRVAGLAGLVDERSAIAGSLVVQHGDGWLTATDPAAFAVGRPDLPGLLAAARAEVTLAAGEHDPMSPLEHLKELAPEPVILPGLGHNAHVEDPAGVQPLLERLLPGGDPGF